MVSGILQTQSRKGFSALQRAENSSIIVVALPKLMSLQRFSALQRAENSSIIVLNVPKLWSTSFSALQRAENSSIYKATKVVNINEKFQCSSASRKFLNVAQQMPCLRTDWFQCSSASRKFLNPDPRTCVHPYFRPR